MLYSVEEINKRVLNEPLNTVREAEERYSLLLSETARKIISDKAEIVLLAGPSAAGKTTTALKLCESFKSFGKRCVTVSLDDFYRLKGEYPVHESGAPDYETVEAIDLPLFEMRFKELFKTGSSLFPVFDFVAGTRSETVKKVKLSDFDIMIIEGLHALNPKITDCLSAISAVKLYINTEGAFEADGEEILKNSDFRFIRRLIRDYHYRNSTAENTLRLWDMVTEGEEKHLLPFKERADIKLNSLHFYEPCLFAGEAAELLSSLPESDPHFEKCKILTQHLKLFENLSESSVPKDSLLREFI